MTNHETLQVALGMLVMAIVVLGPRLWYLARRLGWRAGLDDRDAMLDKVYGAGWKTRLIEHDNFCKGNASDDRSVAQETKR